MEQGGGMVSGSGHKLDMSDSGHMTTSSGISGGLSFSKGMSKENMLLIGAALVVGFLIFRKVK